MDVTVLLFAAHREIVGRSRLAVTLPDGATAQDVFTLLAADHPRLLEAEPFTTFAVNRAVVRTDHLLRDGDEVALLQPVSGGEW